MDALQGVSPNSSAFCPHDPPGFGWLDGGLRYVWLDERLASINGLPVAAHLGMRAEQVGPFGEALADLAGLAAVGAEACHKEVWHPPPAGRCYRLTLLPCRQAEGGAPGAALLVADITGDKTAAWNAAVHSVAGQLLADLSARLGGPHRRELAHDLRNRLTPILTLAQMLGEAERLDAQTLSWAGRSLGGKVADLSARVDAWDENARPPSVPVDLRGLALRAVEAVRPLLGHHRLRLPDSTAWVLADPARLPTPLALCLLRAAEGGGCLEMDIRAGESRATLTMEGRPAQPQDCQRRRGQSGNLPDTPLALAKLALEDCQGSLAADDRPTGGRRIAVTLPLCPAPPRA